MGSRGQTSGIVHSLLAALFGRVKYNPQAIPIELSLIKDKSLQGIEERARHADHEEAFLFDNNGNVIKGVAGVAHTVAIPESWNNIEGATVTHGHIKGDHGFGGTFSVKDVRRMTKTRWAELRVATSGQGEYNYIMRRTSGSDNIGLKKQIIRDREKLTKAYTNKFEEIYEKSIDRGMRREQALHMAVQQAAGIVDTYWKRVLPQFGFDYVKRKKEYRYGR